MIFNKSLNITCYLSDRIYALINGHIMLVHAVLLKLFYLNTVEYWSIFLDLSVFKEVYNKQDNTYVGLIRFIMYIRYT